MFCCTPVTILTPTPAAARPGLPAAVARASEAHAARVDRSLVWKSRDFQVGSTSCPPPDRPLPPLPPRRIHHACRDHLRCDPLTLQHSVFQPTCTGCTFVALAPEHPIVQSLTHARVLPLPTLNSIAALLRSPPALRSNTSASPNPKHFIQLPLQAVHPLTQALLPVFCAAYVRPLHAIVWNISKRFSAWIFMVCRCWGTLAAELLWVFLRTMHVTVCWLSCRGCLL